MLSSCLVRGHVFHAHLAQLLVLMLGILGPEIVKGIWDYPLRIPYPMVFITRIRYASVLKYCPEHRLKQWKWSYNHTITEWLIEVGKDHKEHLVRLVLTHPPHAHLTMSPVPHPHISWIPPGIGFSTPVFHWKFVFLQDSLQRNWDNWTRNITGSWHVFDFS